jgi:50S ribosomal subunit-associated GTPase HflX
VDAANPQAVNQMLTVKKVLEELGCIEKNIVTVFNKIDCLPETEPETAIKLLKQHEPVGIPVSAFKQINLEMLTERATWYFHRPAIHLTLDVDCRAGKLISFLKQHAKIHQTEYTESTARMELTLASHWIGPLRQFNAEFKILASSDPHAIEELNPDGIE